MEANRKLSRSHDEMHTIQWQLREETRKHPKHAICKQLFVQVTASRYDKSTIFQFKAYLTKIVQAVTYKTMRFFAEKYL